MGKFFRAVILNIFQLWSVLASSRYSVMGFCLERTQTRLASTEGQSLAERLCLRYEIGELELRVIQTYAGRGSNRRLHATTIVLNICIFESPPYKEANIYKGSSFDGGGGGVVVG